MIDITNKVWYLLATLIDITNKLRSWGRNTRGSPGFFHFLSMLKAFIISYKHTLLAAVEWVMGLL